MAPKTADRSGCFYWACWSFGSIGSGCRSSGVSSDFFKTCQGGDELSPQAWRPESHLTTPTSALPRSARCALVACHAFPVIPAKAGTQRAVGCVISRTTRRSGPASTHLPPPGIKGEARRAAPAFPAFASVLGRSAGKQSAGLFSDPPLPPWAGAFAPSMRRTTADDADP